MRIYIYFRYQIFIFIFSLTFVTPFAFAEKRHLDSHEHGITELDIAYDNNVIEMELRAPGADIVGFEREAESDAEIAAINRAITLLKKPLGLFTLPKESRCKVTQIRASITREHDDEHKSGEHDDEHKSGEHDDEHKSGEHDDEHKSGEHDDEHKSGEHDDEHKSGEHDDEHLEFQANYTFRCENASAISKINFTYFKVFPNAKLIQIQLVSKKMVTLLKASLESPSVDVSGSF